MEHAHATQFFDHLGGMAGPLRIPGLLGHFLKQGLPELHTPCRWGPSWARPQCVVAEGWATSS